uniref:Transporter 1, ATP-binding cassette, sub-family B (MDR/TAP) n=1 Tax=Neogobius melanostomus TaxID=47308 RepID=A0A8C6T993_9GOBI
GRKLSPPMMLCGGPLLCVCLDVLVVYGLQLAQDSSVPLWPSPLLGLWGGACARAAALLLFCGFITGAPAWMSGARGFLNLCVLCFHFPVYASLQWALELPALEELSGFTWIRVLQGYAVTVLAWIYWSRYISSLLRSSTHTLLSCARGGALEWDGRLLRLLGYMRPYSGRFTVVLVLVVLSSYGEMAFPQYTGRVADWIMNEEAPDAFTEAIRYMVILTVLSAVFEFLCDLTYNWTMSHIHTIVQGEVFRAVLKQEIAFFKATTTGELVSRITTDTNDMSEALSEKLSLLMWYAARFAFILFFMVCQSGKMTLLTLMALPVIWVVPEFLGQFRQSISVQVQESLAKSNQAATETFSNMKTVRSFANEDGETRRYGNSLDHTYHLNKKEAAAYSATTWANSMTTLALKVCILYYGGSLVTRGAVSGGELVSFVLYELQFASAVEAVMRYYPEVKKAIGSSEKIFEYLDRKPQIPPDGTLAPEKLEGDIEFKDVKFSYPEKKDESSPVLKVWSLSIVLGKTNALVGRNGSGKSTCVKLMERFYQPQEGQILLDGEPLSRYQSQYLHDKISVVNQDCLLFARSVEENIKYGCASASDADIKAAAEQACAHQFITTLLSDGYNTDAGAKGGQVSGGQKQRIAIARALIRRPQILILDNATSDLDPETENEIYDRLLNLPGNCTLLLISNKMEVVKSADHIVCLHDGAVQEQGCHEELMKRGGIYTRLVEQQNTEEANMLTGKASPT